MRNRLRFGRSHRHAAVSDTADESPASEIGAPGSLSDNEIAALLYLVVQTQLALAGDENAARIAAFSAAGWTGRLAESVERSLANGSIKSGSPTLTMIQEGLHQIDEIASRDGFSELVTLALGGTGRIHQRALESAAETSAVEGTRGSEHCSAGQVHQEERPDSASLCQALTPTCPTAG